MHTQSQSHQDAAVRALIDAQVQAWNSGDGNAWARQFTDDANFINVRGDIFHGREEIAKQHVFIFGGPFKGSHCDVTFDNVSFPAPGLAVLETTYVVTKFAFLPPGLVPTEPGLFRTRMKYIAAERGNVWHLIAAQNTAVLPAPAKGRFAPTELGGGKH